MDQAIVVSGSGAVNSQAPSVLAIEVRVSDPEVVAALWRHDEGEARERFTLAALRLGVIALQQASGVIDADRVQREGERLMTDLRHTLSEHATSFADRLNGTVATYFDPQTGNLAQRLDRLVSRDGELEAVLTRHLEGDASCLARTLERFVGEQSPLLQLLAGSGRTEFAASVRTAVDELLKAEREQVLRQFSLDDKGSALSRLVSEITDRNGKLRTDLASDIDVIRREFSLDQEDGALSRLVRQVDETTGQVRKSLTLDDAASPLALLRAQLLEVIQGINEANTKFHTEVRATLESLQARRTEASRSTRRGGIFEAAVGELLTERTRHTGDVLECVGTAAGRLQRCKKGDFVIELGPDNAAAGARIVIEAKEDASYDLRKIVEELAGARDNRTAQIGVAIMSKATAPDGMDPLTRIGADVIVVWDRDDPNSDIVVDAALFLARGLAVRERKQSARVQAELSEIERAVLHIAHQADALTEVANFATTARNNAEKIRAKVEAVQTHINSQLELLKQNVDGLKGGDASEAVAA